MYLQRTIPSESRNTGIEFGVKHADVERSNQSANRRPKSEVDVDMGDKEKKCGADHVMRAAVNLVFASSTPPPPSPTPVRAAVTPAACTYI
jgi:hypothetical protein